MPELRFKVLSAYDLAHRWISGVTCPQRTYHFPGASGARVSDVRFVPGYDDRLLLTISKTVWSAMSLWYMSDQDSKIVAQWSPRGAIFTGHTVNDAMGSEATLAVSLQLDGYVTNFVCLSCLCIVADILQSKFSISQKVTLHSPSKKFTAWPRI